MTFISIKIIFTTYYSTLLKLNYVPLLNYIENSIDVYTDEIVLLGTNTEEDIDALLDAVREISEE